MLLVRRARRCVRENIEEKIYVTSEIEITLRVIGGKWKPLILHLLQEEGPRRYMDILRYLEAAPKNADRTVERAGSGWNHSAKGDPDCPCSG